MGNEKGRRSCSQEVREGGQRQTGVVNDWDATDSFS